MFRCIQYLLDTGTGTRSLIHHTALWTGLLARDTLLYTMTASAWEILPSRPSEHPLPKLNRSFQLNILRVSGYVAQLSTQAAVLNELTKLIKSGQYTGKVSPAKIVYVGHSFGSAISITALANDDSLVDGIVLTGNAANILQYYTKTVLAN